MSDDAFWQAAAARTVEKFLGDLCRWVIQPDPGGLPSGWAAACRDRLNELGGLVASRFGRDHAGDSEFRAAAAAARELIGILEGNPRLAVVPVSEWTIAAFVEVFERVAKHCSRFAELASWKRNWEPLQLPLDDSPEARRIQRLAEWRQTVAAIDPLRPEALRQLRVAGAVLWGAEQPGDDPSAAKLNAVAELSRALKPKIRQAAAALGFSAADQAALFAVDYSTHANAWEALQAAAANRAAAVAVESAAVTVAAAPGDQLQVNAKQLAAHAGCSDRQIREVLQDCPAETDSTGRRLWRYCDAVGPLRRWSANHRQDRLRVVWPDLAKNLQKTKAGTKKK